MVDIVIDTCTLKHASDPTSKYFNDSVTFIDKIMSSSILCVVDEGFSLNETENESYIGLEYITHLQPNSLGYQLIYFLAMNERIDFVSKDVAYRDKKIIEQCIRNKKDRSFLKITINSKEKILASHDFEDYQDDKRRYLKRQTNIIIYTANELNDIIQK
jgi:hypothetical protein